MYVFSTRRSALLLTPQKPSPWKSVPGEEAAAPNQLIRNYYGSCRQARQNRHIRPSACNPCCCQGLTLLLSASSRP